MLKNFKGIDGFTKNIIVVFSGTSLASFLNLIYQVLIAHRFSPSDFAAFNSLLSIFAIFSVPLSTLQAAVAKYSAEFSAQNQDRKVRVLLSGFLRNTFILAVIIFTVFYFLSFHIVDKLKIPSVSCGYILAILLAVSCVAPVFGGGLQGLELFKWLMSASVIGGTLKLVLAFIFILLGFHITGALGALLAGSLAGIIISYIPLKDFFSFKAIKENIDPVRDTTNLTDNTIVSNGVDFKEIFLYLFPVILANFCFLNLINLDMILVKYFFSPEDSGFYSLAQMVGKIFLFLPAAISLTLFPRTSVLKAKNMDTVPILKKSLFYCLALCIFAVFLYNLSPALVLKILTGKAYPESVLLGRLFSISMSFFALLFVLIAYFLSLNDLRFLKYLFPFTLLQLLAIILFHHSLIQVQVVLCINAILLFVIHLILAYKKGQ